MLSNKYGGIAFNFFDIISSYKNRFNFLRNIKTNDIIFLEKEFFPFLPFLFEKWIYKKYNVISDHDDAIFHQYDLNHNILVRIFLRNKIDRVFKFSKKVYCGSHYILDRAFINNSKAYFVPTVVDTNKYFVNYNNQNIIPVIVWIGSPATKKYLHLLDNVFVKLSKNIDFELRLIGVKDYVLDNVNIKYYDWNSDSESILLSSSNIGIMPLFDELTERGKCGYKLIQYMASGLPVVGSAVGENKFIINQECGFLANNEIDWYEYLFELIKSSELRINLGFRARDFVFKNYSKINVEKFFESNLINSI
jgi:glycosyltransferase involved in cell wall biosynthesis